MAKFKVGQLARPIAQVISQQRPDLVITFGPDALTRHPDHLAIHHATTLAFEMAAQPGMALFYAGLSELNVSRLSTRLEGSLGSIPLMLTGAPNIEQDTVINVEHLSALKWAAVACHGTQSGNFESLTENDRRLLSQKEYFWLKKVAGGYVKKAALEHSGPFADDLFARVNLCDQLLKIA